MPTPGEYKTVQGRILEYAGGPDQTGFEESAVTYDATLRNLELIEEAATRIPQSVRDVGIDNDTLWSIIRGDVPASRVALRRLREEPPTG